MYVKAEDLNDAEIETPEQAVTKMLNEIHYEIPLYDSDGITVIGSFMLSPVEDINE